MKVLVALVVVAMVAPAALGAPSGLLGGVILAGPSAVSHTSLVQTHPSPITVIAAPAPILAAAPALVAAAPHGAAIDSLIVGPSGVIAERQGLVGTVAVAGHGLGLGGHW